MPEDFTPPEPGQSPLERYLAAQETEPETQVNVAGFDPVQAEATLQAGGVVVMPDGSWKSRVMSPDLYRQTSGQYTISTLRPAHWDIEIPPEEYDRQALQIDKMLEEIEVANPLTARAIAANPQLMFIIPELAGAMDQVFDGYGPAETAVEFLTTDVASVSYQDFQEFYRQSPTVTKFFTDYAGHFDAEQLDVIATALGSVRDPNTRDNIAALAYRWVNRGDDVGARDLSDPTVRDALITYLWSTSERENTRELSEARGFGKFASYLDVPRQAFTNALSDGWAWATSIGTPSDYAARKGLSLGQQIAFTAGLDPSEETSWRWTSGTIDALGAVVADPLNLLIGFGAGRRIAQTVAVTGKAAETGKLALAAKSAIPVVGRRYTTLAFLSRAPSTRFFYSLFSKNTDELLEAAAKKGVFVDMGAVLTKDGIAGLIEKYPQFKHTVDGAAELMLHYKDDSTKLKEIVGYMAQGSYLNETSDAFIETSQKFDRLLTAYRDEVASGLEQGRLSIQSLDGPLSGTNTAAGVFETLDNGLLKVSSLDGSGTRKLLFKGSDPVKVLDMTQDGALTRFAAWAQRGNRASKTLPGLNAKQTKALRDLAKNGVKATSNEAREGFLIKTVQELFEKTNGEPIGKITIQGKQYTVELLRKTPNDGVAIAIRKGGFSGPIVGGAASYGKVPGGGAWMDESIRSEGGFSQLVDLAMAAAPEATMRLVWQGAHDPAITADGAAALNALLPRIVNFGKETTLETTLVDSLVEKLASGAYKHLDQAETAMLTKYAAATGDDLVSFGDLALASDTGARRLIEGVDLEGVPAATEQLSALASQAVRADAVLRTLKAGSQRTWVIADIPPKVENLFLKPWRRVSTNDVDGWWGNFRRTTAARLFEPSAPRSVNIADSAQGALELRRWLRQAGAKREFIVEAVNEFIATPYGARAPMVRRVVAEAGREIGHPILEYGLMQNVDRAGVRIFSMIQGADAAVISSKSRRGATSAVPVLSVHLSQEVDLPGPEFFHMLKRYRKAGTLDMVGGNKRGLVQGFTKSTRNRRAAIAARYRKTLADRLDPEDLARISDADLLHMAYATVSKSGDSGLGKVAQVMGGGKSAYLAFHNVFTRAQLALRPITWAFRVAILEEGVRGTFFEMPTLYRNPVRWAQGFADQHVVAMAQARRLDQAKLIGELVQKNVVPGQAIEVSLQAIDRALPGFAKKYAKRNITSERELRALASRWAQDQLGDLHNIRTLNESGRLSKQLAKASRKVAKTDDVLEKYGLKSSFSYDDIDITNKGFINLFANEMASDIHRVEWVPGGMNTRQIGVYADVYAKTLWDLVSDPAGKIGLRRLQARALNQAPPPSATPEAFVATSTFAKMKPTIKSISDERGWAVANDTEMVAKYFEEIIDPLVDSTFRPLYGSDLDEQARVLGDILSQKSTRIERDGVAFDLEFSSGAPGRTKTGVHDFVAYHAEDPTVPFPQALAGRLDFRFMVDDSGGFISRSWQKSTNKIMEYAGERVTQTMNRRPSWLNAHKDAFHYYQKMGLPDGAARKLAEEWATEITNYVYYNMDNATPFLRSMNKIVPFFAAFWEVAQTWAYKIPLAKGGLSGAPMMVHKVDRILDGLRNIGILQYEVSDTAGDGKLHTTSAWLTFADDPEQWNISGPGSVLSKAGFEMLNFGKVGVKQLINVYNLFADVDVDIDDAAFKDVYRYQVGNPLTPLDVIYRDGQFVKDEGMQHGIMAVNNLYLGLNPIGAFVLSQVRASTPWAGDAQLEDAVAGESLQQMADRLSIDVDEMVRVNTIELRAQLGNETVSRLLRGAISPEEVILDGTEYVSVPRSSLVSALLDEVFFTFGTEETVAGSLYNLTPSWLGYVMRGFGVWQSSGDPSNWAHLDDNGQIVLPDEFPTFLEALSGPTERMQVVGEINNQLLHLEASEQLISRWREQVTLLEKVTQDALESGYEQLGGGAVTTLEGDGDPALHEAWVEQKNVVDEFNAYIIKRAVDNAGAALIFRGFAGGVSPGTPRMLFDEQRQVQSYWEALEIAQGLHPAAARKSENFLTNLPTTIEDFQIRQSLIKEFLEDPSGDEAKAWIWRNYPELGVFTTGISYFGPAGAPLEFSTWDDYAEQVQNGTRLPLPPGVTMQKALRAMVAADRGVAITEQFGGKESVWEEAAAIVNDFGSYQDILQEASVRYAALDFWDDNHNGSEYINWRNRNQDETLVLAEELARRAREITRTVGLLEDFSPSQDMSDADRRQYTAMLRNAASGFREFIGEWQEDMDTAGFDSPREKALNWYFDEVIAPYYDGLASLYEKIDEATDSEAQSRVYDEIRRYETQEFITTRSKGGATFPNALEFSWSRKDPEEQQDRMLRWMALKPEWLGLQATARLVENQPGLQPYLPSTPDQFAIYEEYNAELNWLADQVEPGSGPDGGRAMTSTERDDYKAELDERLVSGLAAQGRHLEAEFQRMYPMERLQLAGILPPQLGPFVENVTFARQHLERIEKGPLSKEGIYLFDQIALKLEAAIGSDPALRVAVLDLGSTMWDEHEFDTILPKLLFNGFGEY